MDFEASVAADKSSCRCEGAGAVAVAMTIAVRVDRVEVGNVCFVYMCSQQM